MPDEPKPDALMIPKNLAGGGDYRQKMVKILAIARPLMGLSDGDIINVPFPANGPDYYVRKGPHDNDNGINFATDHERAGEPRHDWTKLDNGIKVGRLKPDPAPEA